MTPVTSSDVLSQPVLQSMFAQGPSGRLYWRPDAPAQQGAIAVSLGESALGRQYVKFGSVRVSAEKIIWAMHTGAWPNGAFRYRNGDKHDTRFINLVPKDKADLV